MEGTTTCTHSSLSVSHLRASTKAAEQAALLHPCHLVLAIPNFAWDASCHSLAVLGYLVASLSPNMEVANCLMPVVRAVFLGGGRVLGLAARRGQPAAWQLAGDACAGLWRDHNGS